MSVNNDHVTVLQWAAAVLAGVTALAIAINAIYMIISPRAWFGLPSYLRLNGSLTKGKYTKGLRADGVRGLGAILLAVVGWMIYSFWVHR